MNQYCPACRQQRLVRIDLEISGRAMKIHSCSRCDRRWWQQGDRLVSLASVLDAVRDEMRAVRASRVRAA